MKNSFRTITSNESPTQIPSEKTSIKRERGKKKKEAEAILTVRFWQANSSKLPGGDWVLQRNVFHKWSGVTVKEWSFSP